MKINGREYKKKQKIVNHHRCRRKNSKKRKLKRKYLARNLKTIKGKIIAFAPMSLDLISDEDHRECVNFIKSFSQYPRNSRIYISFENLEKVTFPTLVYLFSSLDKLMQKGTIFLLHKLPHNEIARDHLERAGIPNLINGNKIKHDPKKDQNLPVISDTEARHEDIVEYINNRIYGGALSDERQWLLGDAISEAFNNVNQHAYPNSLRENRRWWSMCEVHEEEEQLYISIFDAGVGIPKTLLKPDSWIARIYGTEKIRLLKNDSKRIRFAMQAGTNRRNEDKHGQGSESYLDLVDSNPKGQLWILSNKGRYVTYTSGKERQEDIHEYKESIGGTLVQWNISTGENNGVA